MKSVISKLLTIVTLMRFPKMKKKYRDHIRDNYYCRVRQLNYFAKDYLYKKKYKTIEFYGEFDQELRYVLPFAYWHYLNGTLKKTISSRYTMELYYFSENHEEKQGERSWEGSVGNFEIPNMKHSLIFSYNKFARVPLKDYYKNNLFLYARPILIIANKYNFEWDNSPINYIDKNVLGKIFENYKDKYQIIYNRPLATQIVSDNSMILDLNEFEWIRNNYPDVLLMNDLYERNKKVVNNYNHLQLMIYANCNHFISVHGGTAALASYFGGINIILSKSGVEHYFNEFETIFPALSGAHIIHAKTEDELLRYLKDNI
ncbi:MAG: hypothetical protein H0V14_07225 [Chitinophagaceae bacterium]|nr:hypothetical protein [Chitinophagaceae bacterium]